MSMTREQIDRAHEELKACVALSNAQDCDSEIWRFRWESADKLRDAAIAHAAEKSRADGLAERVRHKDILLEQIYRALNDEGIDFCLVTSTAADAPVELQSLKNNRATTLERELSTAHAVALKDLARIATAERERDEARADRSMFGEAIVAMSDNGWLYHGPEGMSDEQTQCYMAYLKYKKPDIYEQELKRAALAPKAAPAD